MNLIQRYSNVSRECDGIMKSLEAEKSRQSPAVRLSFKRGGAMEITRTNVSRIAFLEQALAARQAEAAVLWDGLAEIEKADTDRFWLNWQNAVTDARSLASYRKDREAAAA